MVKNATQRRHVISRQPVTEPEGHLKEGEKLVWAAAYSARIAVGADPHAGVQRAHQAVRDLRKFYAEHAQEVRPDEARHMLDDFMEG
jgi:hypothetical protein